MSTIFFPIHLHQRCLVDADILIYYDSLGGMEYHHGEAICLASFGGGAAVLDMGV